MLPQNQIYLILLAMLVIVWTEHVLRNELSKNRIKLVLKLHFLFEVVFLVFGFWVSYTTKNWSKWKLPQISKYSISGIGQNRKLRNLWNFISLFVFLRFCFLLLFLSWVFASKGYNKKGEKTQNNTETLEMLILTP